MNFGSRGCLLALAVTLSVLPAVSGGQRPSRDEERARDNDICGYRLMTERERAEYRERVQGSQTEEELHRLVREHREQMQARARERGVTLTCDKAQQRPTVRSTNARPAVVACVEGYGAADD